MGGNSEEKIHRVNYLCSEIDSVYHQASLKFGFSDSCLRVLYTICDNGTRCPLSDIYKQSGISRQTVNSALRKLEQAGVICLEKRDGRAKDVALTADGQRLAAETVARLYRAEQEIYEAWSEQEYAMYVNLMEKYMQQLRAAVEKL